MSRFRFAIPTLDQASELLAWRRRKDEYQAELYHDAVACERALLPATSVAERRAVKAFTLDRSTLFSCAVCDRFAFNRPTICFWCETSNP